jgi:hypothetical protein
MKKAAMMRMHAIRSRVGTCGKSLVVLVSFLAEFIGKVRTQSLLEGNYVRAPEQGAGQLARNQRVVGSKKLWTKRPLFRPMLRLLLAFAERISTEAVKGMEGGQR